MYQIMIVEDDLRLHQEIEEGLSKWGFNPVTVKNFQDILNEFVQNRPELVIMDINKTEFPEIITQPVQYDENLQALMVYLSNYQLITLARTSELIGALTGQKIS